MHHGRYEDVDRRARLGAGETFRAHPNDLVNVVAYAESAPDHCRISSEAVRPIVVREHGVRVSPWREIVAFSQQPPQGGPQSERAEHPTGNVLPVRFLHLLVGPVGQIRPFRIRDRYQLGLIFNRSAHQAERRIRPGVVCLGLAIETDSLTSQSVQLLRLSHWERPQQEGVDKPERRRACPDRESQRKDGCGRGHLPLHELPPAEDRVGAQRIQPCDEPDVTALFAQP